MQFAPYLNFNGNCAEAFAFYKDLFKGQIVHPQHWPEDLDYTGKKVVVIGGGNAADLLQGLAAPTQHRAQQHGTPWRFDTCRVRLDFANRYRTQI